MNDSPSVANALKPLRTPWTGSTPGLPEPLSALAHGALQPVGMLAGKSLIAGYWTRGFSVNWKPELQVRDLEPEQRLEMTCETCGHVHYLIPVEIMASPNGEFLNEVERETYCKARRCLGTVRMAIIRKDSASGFVGGMA